MKSVKIIFHLFFAFFLLHDRSHSSTTAVSCTGKGKSKQANKWDDGLSYRNKCFHEASLELPRTYLQQYSFADKVQINDSNRFTTHWLITMIFLKFCTLKRKYIIQMFIDLIIYPKGQDLLAGINLFLNQNYV